ncbi:hypothetical protein JWS13_00160 (plasmid) [Rhodococcus pseudokoreensis]|uniref:Lipoprotein n=1 Tax=Rhodococcus pseudokoreensis TaxID=2811421 RepID=A0A974ZQV9_9NOCA|nr:hypothetical protein [Rhodococcus pseudokoreensis]QSE87161.1 hypothetical protein JWS13_00160 [Rhodococcus pseudokoreensis]
MTSEFSRPAGRGVQGSGYSAVQDFDMEGERVMSSGRWVGVVGGLAVMSVVAACGGSPTKDPAPLVFGTENALQGPPGTLPSPEQQAGDQAVKAVSAYFQELLAIEKDPSVDLARLDRISGQPNTGKLRFDFDELRSAGVVAVGTVDVIATTVLEVKAPKDEYGNPIPGTATASLRVCVDRSEYDRKNRNGVSVLPPDHLDAELSKPSMENPAWPDPSGWRVVWDQIMDNSTACDAP